MAWRWVARGSTTSSYSLISNLSLDHTEIFLATTFAAMVYALSIGDVLALIGLVQDILKKQCFPVKQKNKSSPLSTLLSV
jgi:hypothetical protein